MLALEQEVDVVVRRALHLRDDGKVVEGGAVLGAVSGCGPDAKSDETAKHGDGRYDQVHSPKHARLGCLVLCSEGASVGVQRIGEVVI